MIKNPGKVIGLIAFLILVYQGVALPSMRVINDNTIKIGVVGPHTGDLANYGIPTLNAVEIITEKVNAKGGIKGKKIVIIRKNDQCKPEVAKIVAKELVSEKVDVVLGGICSGATRAAMPIYKKAGILAISPSATLDDLTLGGKYPNFFRTIASNYMQAPVMARFAIEKLSARRIAIVFDDGSYGLSIAREVRKFIEQSNQAKVVLSKEIPAGAIDYSSAVSAISDRKADAVIFVATILKHQK